MSNLLKRAAVAAGVASLLLAAGCESESGDTGAEKKSGNTSARGAEAGETERGELEATTAPSTTGEGPESVLPPEQREKLETQAREAAAAAITPDNAEAEADRLMQQIEAEMEAQPQ